MKNIDVKQTIQKARDALDKEQNISKTTRATFESLVSAATLLMNRLALNRKNSSKPPTTDNNDKKKKKNNKSGKKRGGQNGHLLRAGRPGAVSRVRAATGVRGHGRDHTAAGVYVGDRSGPCKQEADLGGGDRVINTTGN